MFHEAIYQGLIVRFSPLEEVFSRLVCCHEKSELSTHSVSLCTPRPLASCGLNLLPGLSSSGISPFGVLPPVNTILQELRNVSHWLVYCNHSHFAHCYFCCPLHVLSLLVHSYPIPQCFSCHDDGLSSRVDHHCLISVFSQPYGAISLSPYLRRQQHLPSLLLNVFKTRFKRLILFCLSDRPCRFHIVIRFNLFFLLPSFLFLSFSYILSTRCYSDLTLLIPLLQGALLLKTPAVGKRRALAIQFVF